MAEKRAAGKAANDYRSFMLMHARDFCKLFAAFDPEDDGELWLEVVRGLPKEALYSYLRAKGRLPAEFVEGEKRVADLLDRHFGPKSGKAILDAQARDRARGADDGKTGGKP